MSTDSHAIVVDGIEIDVVRKDIKNLHLGVYPPNGRVRVAAPLAIDDDTVRMAVVTRLPWIRRRQSGFAEQERQSQREYVSGESHYYLGRRYRLDVIHEGRDSRVHVRNGKQIELTVPVDSDRNKRERIVQKWYREELRCLAEPIIVSEANRLELPIPSWGIRRMKTRWGTCNPSTRRIWINLELIKKPIPCLEYIIVHELVHFFERSHSERFTALMDRFMPLWRNNRDVLNSAPLAHEDWSY